MHRNLLLPCDHLPLKVPLKVARSQRKMLKQTDEKTQQENESDEDSEDDWFYYLPQQPPQAPQDTHPQACDREGNIGPTADSETTGVHPNEREEQGRLMQLREDPGGVELLDTDEASEELELLGENPVPPPPSPPPRDSQSESEQAQGRPRRERRPPKLFTYNEFGNPVCCSMGPPARSMYRFHPMQHYRGHQPGTMWPDFVQYPTYQPVPLHG